MGYSDHDEFKSHLDKMKRDSQEKAQTIFIIIGVVSVLIFIACIAGIGICIYCGIKRTKAQDEACRQQFQQMNQWRGYPPAGPAPISAPPPTVPAPDVVSVEP